jgi:Rps23 Pro-64 3,4-dihydroxylase Tpa1-like proline 4-hydroxylase
VWQRLHLPAWVHFLEAKIQPAQPLVQETEPLVFVEVNPEQTTADAPKNTKYYSSQNSRAANPEADRDTNVPQLNGKQTEIAKTEDVTRPNFSKLQPATPQVNQQPEARRPMLEPGDLTLAKLEDFRQQERPRTLQQAHRLPGQQMKQEGGVHRQALVPSFDVKATPFGAYDAAFIEAVTQRWYDLLDSRQFARDRSGKVILRFHLNYDGRISDMNVTENTVGDVLGYVCQKAVMDPAPYAKWPTDMREMMNSDYREITFTFYYY